MLQPACLALTGQKGLVGRVLQRAPDAIKAGGVASGNRSTSLLTSGIPLQVKCMSLLASVHHL